MSDVMSGAMVALLAAFMAYMLRSLGYDGGRLVSVVGVVALLCGIVLGIGRIVDMLPLALFAKETEDVFKIALKMLGIGYIFGAVSDICREMGENGLANMAQGLGRVEIFALVMPYIGDIVRAAGEMIKS